MVGKLVISEYAYDGLVDAFAHAYTSDAGNEVGMVGIVGLPLKSPYAPDVATVAKPETEPAAIEIAVDVADVILPVESTDIAETADDDPYDPAATPEFGSLAASNVPELILPAFVVSVVAEVANPETALEAIAILVAVTAVTLPFASTVIAGTADADPNEPVLVPALLNLASGKVPEVILLAFVVSVVAEAANVGYPVI